jgi:hypothetical protein
MCFSGLRFILGVISEDLVHVYLFLFLFLNEHYCCVIVAHRAHMIPQTICSKMNSLMELDEYDLHD